MPSSDSDSEDDCYGNFAQKLQSLKNKYPVEKPSVVLQEDNSVDHHLSPINFETVHVSTNDSIVDLLEDVPPVPDMPPPILPNAPVSKSPKKRTTRRTRLNSAGSPVSAAPLPPSRRGRKRKSDADPPVADGVVASVASTPPATPTPVEAAASSPPVRGGRARGTRGNQRGQVRGRGRGRGRGRSRDHMEYWMGSLIYSVGNTHEYPDTAENIPLFSKSTNKAQENDDDVYILAADDVDLDNEELSVKVCWQQMEYNKFNIRRFQKLTPIFEFYSKRESVPVDRLLFMLRDRILKPDDSPDSIQYNVAWFIDGGVVDCSVTNVLAGSSSNKENKTSASGILLKFQCQNVKKPFETNIELNQKLSTAMIKCAEHFELPYAKLRFMLDGESLSAASTPADHDLDNGDCIDVKMAA